MLRLVHKEIGRIFLNENTITIDEKEYLIDKHGLMRKVFSTSELIFVMLKQRTSE